MRCPCCGTENEPFSKFCRMCGTPLTQQPEGNGTAQPNPGPQSGTYYPPAQAPYPPGYPGQYGPPGPRPFFNSTNAVIAILFGFLCGLWIGGVIAVIGLIKGGRADDYWAMGDWQGAYNAVKEGDKLVKISWIASVAGFLLALLYFLFVVLFFSIA